MCVPGIQGKFLVFLVNLVFSSKTKKNSEMMRSDFSPNNKKNQ